MKRNQWMLSILSILFCVIAVVAYPTRAEAASQSNQNAYRAIFDASYYYNSYPDVAAVCGMDENALFEHFINFGIYEGRSCSTAFNPQVYRQRYTDLQQVFGNDMAAYCQHYVLYGRNEGRDASAGGQAATPIAGSASVSRVTITENHPTGEGLDKQEVKIERDAEGKNARIEQTGDGQKEDSTKRVKTDNVKKVEQDGAKTETNKITETAKEEEKKIEAKTKTTETVKTAEIEKEEEKKIEAKTKTTGTAKEVEKKTEDKIKTAKTEETNTKTVKESEKKSKSETKSEVKNESNAEKSETAKNIKSTEEILATELPEASISETDVKMVKSAATERKPSETPKAKGQVIGTYTTEYEDNISRAVNVELAAERINGIEVQPGGKFSFSNTILERTAANGYVNGPVYVKGKEVQGIGGGVCQVSSTLYAAMVDAGLKATERHAHSMPVDYVPQNLDATIAGDYLDLKFTNTFSQTLLIEAQAENGTLTVTLVLEE